MSKASSLNKLLRSILKDPNKQGNRSCLWIGRLNVVIICKFNAIPIPIPMRLFLFSSRKTDRLKFAWGRKRPNSQNNLEKDCRTYNT